LPVTFTDLGVSADLSSRLAEHGVTEPFPIQAATIPAGLAGRDVSGRAPTGSGKTLAFGIPIVSRVGRARPGRPRALVLAPTRELAAQIERALSPLAATRQRRVTALYGGVGFGSQLAALRRGADVVVATPGRLADLIERRQVDLTDVEIVVVDEADRMADMGFLPQVRRLLDQVREIDILVRRYQREPLRHEVRHSEGDEDRRRHLFWKIDRAQRAAVAAQVVARHDSTVVFCRTKRGADRLARQLTLAGLPVAAIHGDRSQAQREKALAAFADGRVQALVATDVAARGIHVDAVGCVLHFDPPEDEKAYVHRSGKALGLPRLTTGPDFASLGEVVRSAPPRPKREAMPEARKPEAKKPERARKDWGAVAAVPTPRRKPDGRPARGGGRRRAQTRRSA